jgi:TatD DNase family protein
VIDSHSHIYTPRYDEDREAVIERAVAAGVRQLLQVGCNLEESRAVVDLANAIPGIYASVGVHPHDASTVNQNVLDEIEKLVVHPKVVAWGEIGLDFYYDNSPRDVQIEAFEAQIQYPEKHGLPVVIHTRDAEPETLDVLRRYPVSRGGHVHCFTGTAPTAKAMLDMGYHIGFTGIITFKKAAELREVVKIVPLERLLIETDSPYLAPVPHRGKRNEPAFVAHVAEAIAAIKDVSLEEVLEVTTENFYRVYERAGTGWVNLSAAV